MLAASLPASECKEEPLVSYSLHNKPEEKPFVYKCCSFLKPWTLNAPKRRINI